MLNGNMTSSESENEADDFVEGLTPYMFEPERAITPPSSNSAPHPVLTQMKATTVLIYQMWGQEQAIKTGANVKNAMWNNGKSTQYVAESIER